MKLLRLSAISFMGIVALGLGSAESIAQGACDGSGKQHVIQVRPGPDGKPELKYQGGSAEEVHVCLGDEVRWVLNGSDRDFLVDFFAGAPFAGDEKQQSHGNTVSVVIGGPAEPGNSYSYDVAFDGGPSLDPHIVVDE